MVTRVAGKKTGKKRTRGTRPGWRGATAPSATGWCSVALQVGASPPAGCGTAAPMAAGRAAHAGRPAEGD